MIRTFQRRKHVVKSSENNTDAEMVVSKVMAPEGAGVPSKDDHNFSSAQASPVGSPYRRSSRLKRGLSAHDAAYFAQHVDLTSPSPSTPSSSSAVAAAPVGKNHPQSASEPKKAAHKTPLVTTGQGHECFSSPTKKSKECAVPPAWHPGTSSSNEGLRTLFKASPSRVGFKTLSLRDCSTSNVPFDRAVADGDMEIALIAGSNNHDVMRKSTRHACSNHDASSEDFPPESQEADGDSIPGAAGMLPGVSLSQHLDVCKGVHALRHCSTVDKVSELLTASIAVSPLKTVSYAVIPSSEERLAVHESVKDGKSVPTDLGAGKSGFNLLDTRVGSQQAVPSTAQGFLFGQRVSCLRTADSDPAQTVAEAHEKGEHMQVVDEAVYALDGLRPESSIGIQRESLATLTELLATRRGREALKVDSLAQQVLTTTAKLRGAADPAIATSSSILLLALSMPDAHPSYLASSAAAVLMSQLLQAKHDTASLGLAMTGAGDKKGVARQSTERLTQKGKDCDSKLDLNLQTALERCYLLVNTGQLGRHIASALGLHEHPTGRPNQQYNSVPSRQQQRLPSTCYLVLLLLGMVQATSTDTSRVHFTERVKHNLRKVKALDQLADLAASRCELLQTEMMIAPAYADYCITNSAFLCTTTSLEVGAYTSLNEECDVSHTTPSNNVHNNSTEVEATLPAAPHHSMAAADNPPASSCVWDFPDDEEEEEEENPGVEANHVSGCKKVGNMAHSQAGARLHGKASCADYGKQVSCSDMEVLGSDHGASCCKVQQQEQQPAVASDLERLRLALAELQLCLAVLENATFACKENEHVLVNMKVTGTSSPAASPTTGAPPQHLKIFPNTKQLTDPSSEFPFVRVLASLLNVLPAIVVRSSREDSSTSTCGSVASLAHSYNQICHSAGQCLQSAVGLLMNLTHEHEQGVHAVVETGALELLVQLLRLSCCKSSGSIGFSNDTSDNDDSGVPLLAEAGCSAASTLSTPPPVDPDFNPDRSVILEHLDLVTMCLGLLINLTSTHQNNRTLLRNVRLHPVGSSSTGHGDVGGGCLVPLLCQIVNMLASSSPPTTQDTGTTEQQHGVIPHSDYVSGHGQAVAQPAVVSRDMSMHASLVINEDPTDSTPVVAHAFQSPTIRKPVVEVTADELSGGYEDGEAAIVQSYSAVLLGFLVIDCEASRSLACSLLCGNSLTAIRTAIKRCLDFYSQTGAITDSCRMSLTMLLEGLEQYLK
ncbi:hypothetical protein CEUSTIGMA_g3190.t1 [Chlamydomonas eustigma]|uniref:Wings apart-like protein C-terminal domain-containing protein n=1 Tax=Chlamydomonas eustigma TaxID=1157962 RepID=A0A250WY36_9CHLO|nr:hypothetical protein CEUSTIGMA_g3190.t1 [Chlamydomonas eustigma]|eukprot:GAX75747.1 hypothetical protein CEUSTIGMA_g3190.t1 [Chlamydomonas eustigma]